MFLSIITINRNNAKGLKKTLESVASQTCRDFEYIIIDGASTDDSVDVIKDYINSPAGKNVSYWVSEPDSGIYNAMNKGIEKARGEWINFINSGDTFFDSEVIQKVLDYPKDDSDVLFGDSIEIDGDTKKEFVCSPDSNELLKHPTYRHGASFVRTELHKKFPFDLSKKHLGFALDYNCIYQLKLNDYKFKKIPVMILTYKKDGISSQNFIKTSTYIYRITRKKKPFYATMLFLYNILFANNIVFIKLLFLLSSLYHLILNHFINHIPIYIIRKFFFLLCGMKIGTKTRIDLNQYFIAASQFKIGKHCHINHNCFIDARGGILIHDNVSISHYVKLVTGSHDVNSTTFEGKFSSIEIDDNAWIGINAIILQGIKIGKGAVVCAGAVVTKDIGDYEIVAGIPAKVIGHRNKQLNYICHPEEIFV